MTTLLKLPVGSRIKRITVLPDGTIEVEFEPPEAA